ncbi:hypothetical protein B0A50_02204 [Salinomyces thailandicus]|uniref:Uncharacterized protein n=1 Tax=Salinomyces thailandicus TaxID=706561 RepID=A0A4V5N7U4_9PEZI|nr:hypothetical protein B0A50_02204 [Salinomyces thailandica]
MSKAANSPTARLLQSSRLFSLPRPLPAPQLENVTSTGVYRSSDTATLPYPTHQAITTPQSSRHRGDWGLKRALPSKATHATSTPHIRVSAQDTAAHITDFGSAADHTQTYAKWREMGVPMLMQPGRNADRKQPPLSPFDDALDNTTETKSRESTQTNPQPQHRWKYTGPWIAGMQEGTFDLYTQQLAKRKPEWREYLKAHVTEQRLTDRRRVAQESGESLTSSDLARLRTELRPNDLELREAEKELRDSHALQGLSSEFTALVSRFLDLPNVRPESSDSHPPVHTSLLRETLKSFASGNSPDSAPPSTHPSAGLSYLRTNAVMENHPLHGPQAQRAPVLSRVVRARNAVTGTEHQAKLGVGGVVASDPLSSSTSFSGRGVPKAPGNEKEYDADTMAASIDPDLEGGNKMYVHPKFAHIDENGRVRLTVDRGRDEAIAVKRGNVDHIHESRAATSRGSVPGGSFAAPGTVGNANYGFALPQTRREQQVQARRSPGYGEAYRQQPRPASRPEVQGFDQELGQQGQGRMDDETATARIRELFESRERQS